MANNNRLGIRCFLAIVCPRIWILCVVCCTCLIWLSKRVDIMFLFSWTSSWSGDLRPKRIKECNKIHCACNLSSFGVCAFYGNLKSSGWVLQTIVCLFMPTLFCFKVYWRVDSMNCYGIAKICAGTCVFTKSEQIHFLATLILHTRGHGKLHLSW